MRRSVFAVLFLALLASSACGAEQAAQSRIVSVSLFKNGLAVVHRQLQVPGPGTYRIEDVPDPVHGTYWIASDAKVVTQVTRREVETTARRSPASDFQTEFAGKEVVVHLIDQGVPPVSGTVVDLPPAAGEEAWDRSYQPRYTPYWHYSEAAPATPQGPMLVVQTPRGRSYVTRSRIAHIEVKDAGATVKQRRPVLLLSVTGIQDKATTIGVSYLARGMAWAPSYEVDLSDPKTLLLRQQAVVKNELERVDDAEIELISGFPSVEFAHVTSPLSLRTTWAQFFQQLQQSRQANAGILGNGIVSQQVVTSNEPAPAIDMSAIPTGEGVDLHYQGIGRHTLAEGDSLATEVASGKTPYQTIVEWVVPDTRTAQGGHISEHERRSDPERFQDAAWDSVRFRNPLAFPMTTGPAMFVSRGRFNGQRTSHWVNPGEETTLHVTKALSIRTRSTEVEEPGQREELWIGGTRYHRTTVKGELWVNNHRKQTVPLVIRRRFSGDLLEAAGQPTALLLEEGVYSANKRNQLTWNVQLEPGQEVRLIYRYSLLVQG